ncbi:hypothetical protein BGW80DRAFT_1250100 [Lactifluus volemus]|nr:hypothetical protein BGW80DRAFT_1449514 [Lactifluus volemus]KAH9976573.1 hypothetical protein BGW80DRAFT_1250100 [Lactifluus volemus]
MESTNSSTTRDEDDPTLSTLPLLTQDTRQVLALLRYNKLHLANPSLLDHVQWVPSARRFVLVMKEKVKNKYQVAKLECVGELNPDKFWLHPCGGWVGPKGPANNWAKPTLFEKTRARGSLRRPQHPDLHPFWDAYVSNLDAVLTLATSTAKDAGIDHSILEKNEIRIRHSVFMHKQNTKNDLGEDFSTKAMPCKSEGAKKALAEIIEKGIFQFNPLPATDIDRSPIPPKEYESSLSGATVLATISLSCDRFQKGWQFYADVQALTVLCEPSSIIEEESTSETMSSKFNVTEVARKKARTIE